MSDLAPREARALSGAWRALPAGDLGPGTVGDAELDADGWPAIDVPGHWRSHPDFAEVDGPVVYHHRFNTGPHTDGERQWLVFEGIFYASDVWLDGTYLGTTEGYFNPHAFEVSAALGARTEHHLALEVGCDPPGDRTAKRQLTGVFDHWDLRDQTWNPGGIWRPVRVERTGPVRILTCRVRCRRADPSRAVLALDASLDHATAGAVTVTTTVTGPDGREQRHTDHRELAAGTNHLAWSITVPDPLLWWPAALGDQPRYTVSIAVQTDDGASSDEVRVRTGLREVSQQDWVLSVNGERLFCKGANQGPTRMALAEATPTEIAADVDLARQAGLDLLRVHAHIARPELYDAADEAGLLLWQDLPLQWGYARSVRQQARRQAAAAVDLLAHHPAIVLWCGHNEPFAIDVAPEALEDRRRLTRLVARGAASTVLPTWNKTVLDHTIARMLRRRDGTRPVLAHSGVLPHPPRLTGDDTHLYFGWYHGHAQQLPTALRWWPRLSRFVSEFGAQAVPTADEFMDAGEWPELDWDRLAQHHALQKPMFDRHVPPADYERYEDWKTATQQYQADLIKLHVETLRRLKYRPAGGFAQFCLADGFPSVTWSVLDHERRPKAGYAALQEACAPIVVIGDWLPDQLRCGAALRQQLHVVNDTRAPLRDMVLEAAVSWGTGAATTELAYRRWQGDVDADTVAYVATLDLVLPGSPGPLAVELTLTGDSVEASNRYTSTLS